MQWSRRARKWKYYWALRDRQTVISNSQKMAVFKMNKKDYLFYLQFLEVIRWSVQAGQAFLHISFGQSRNRGCPFTS